MDLFEHSHQSKGGQEQPLAARMRPRSLEEFIGQEHILAPGRLLWRAIQADQLSSLIFYGPPGTGKTTLAAVIANTTLSHFETLNAVLAGIADIRKVSEEAKQRIIQYQRRTILFVDEVHRWNKAQQDALLPWVENGTVILIGATTENPYFTVNRALVSRSRIFQLQPLQDTHLEKIAQAAIKEPERGYGKWQVQFDKEALSHIVNVANGDARAVLNAIELAVETTQPDLNEVRRITMDVAEESIQRRAVLYDKEGDYHFDTISAFIKSMRGSDPDATMYWLAKMVYAGEDPRFLFRRMLIFAAEDVGLADPQALAVVEAAAAAFDRVGLPEGQYHLGMAALHLATAGKSNSVFAYFDALSTVEKEREGEVPNHLKDASRDKEAFGHGKGYAYPHAYREHWVAQQYLPSALQGKLFYRPGNIGYEKQIAATIARRREAQLAATLETEKTQNLPEILTFSPRDHSFERWLSRAAGTVGENLARLRSLIFEKTLCQRHHRILCLADETGLLTWEALRQTPEGGVYVQVENKAAAATLQARIAECPELKMPTLMCGETEKIAEQLTEPVVFERIIGRSVVFNAPDKSSILKRLRQLLAENGLLILAEPINRRLPRLADLLDFPKKQQRLAEIFRATEEHIYQNPQDPMVNWDEQNAVAWFDQAGFAKTSLETVVFKAERHFSESHIDSWFETENQPQKRPGLGQLLAKEATPEEIAEIKSVVRKNLAGRSIPWPTHFLIATGDNQS